MVPSSEITAFQAVVKLAMDLSVTVQHPTRTSDGAGGFTESFATVATTVCSMGQPTAEMLQNYDYLIGSLSAWRVRLPVGTTVLENDHLVVSGQTLRVQVVFQPRSRQIALDLLATEVQ